MLTRAATFQTASVARTTIQVVQHSRLCCSGKLIALPRHVIMAASANGGSHQKSKEDQVLDLINRQLELYNARNVEEFMTVFSDDVLVTDAVTGNVLAKSKAELTPRYVTRFSTPVHCELIGRLALGNVVVDREIITGLPNDGVAECMATYVVDTEAQPMKIKKVQFAWKPRTFGVKL